MQERPVRLIDLYCGGGGAAMGYHQAGITDITGVDLAPQPRYPFSFVQADAMEYLTELGHEYDLIHASPPCQAYSIMNNLPWNRHREYPVLILPTIEGLEWLGKPYVVENVMGARHGAKGLKKRGLEAHGLKAGWLCGAMFGKPFYRHRLFATNWLWLAPGHPKHSGIIQLGRQLKARADVPVLGGTHTTAAGHAAGWRLAAVGMGVDWMNRMESRQAVPPGYTKFMGAQWLAVVGAVGA